MTGEPHPLRCETCRHRLPDCDADGLGSRVCKKIFLEDPKSLQIGIPYYIDIVGCASHSSAGPVPEPEKTNGGDPWNCTDLGIECPDPEQDWCNWPCDKWLEYHDAGVARAERERVLLAVLETMEHNQGGGIHTGWVLADPVFRKVESLRSGEGGGRHG